MVLGVGRGGVVAHSRRLTKLLVRKLKGLEQIKDILLERYEVIEDARYVIRRDEAAEYVAARLGVLLGPTVRRKVRIAAAILGFHPIRHWNVRLFTCIKATAMTNEQALDHSKASRPKKYNVGIGASRLPAL